MIKIGSQILWGCRWLMVDAIDPETGMLFCVDQDGEEFEISESQVDRVLEGGSYGNDVGEELSWR